MPRGISLHIGLNSVDPNGYGGWSGPLDGCEPDARDMKKLAADFDYKVSMLLTTQATSTAVLSAMAEAAKVLKSGDSYFLTYSGHGSWTLDENSDEPDGRDETWCLYDRQVLDDELYAMYRKFAAGVRVFVLSDSCHSGSVIKVLPPDLRAKAGKSEDISAVMPNVYKNGKQPIRYRIAPKSAREANATKYKDVLSAVQLIAESEKSIDPQAGVLLISGCQDNQLSADLGTNGLFTKRLLEAHKKVGPKGSFQRLYKEIKSYMPPDQTPNLMTVGIGGPGLPDLEAFRI